jgi:hypothetical protein
VGGTRGDWGGIFPPSLYVKKGPVLGKEMLHIANRYLKKMGKLLIKSKETCRSFGRCRNKRSRHAKQHRGRNLRSYMRPQKDLHTRHINVHYNQAHIKNYTVTAFESSSIKPFVCRRAMDDKAYVLYIVVRLKGFPGLFMYLSS